MSTELGERVLDVATIDLSAGNIGHFLVDMGLEPSEVGATTIHLLPADPETDAIASHYIGNGNIELQLPSMSVWLQIKHDICRSLGRSLGYRALDRPFGTLEQEQKDIRFRAAGSRIYRYLGNALLGITSAVTIGETTSPLGGYIGAATIGLGAASLFMSRKKASDAFDELDSPIARAVRITENKATAEWLQIRSRAHPY